MSPSEFKQLSQIMFARSWTFSRQNGQVFARALKFGRDGSIHGYFHEDERAWRFNEGHLEFLREDGAVSTRFETFDIGLSGQIRMSGPVIGVQPTIFHELQSNIVLWDFKLPPVSRPKVALLIRTHVVNEKLYNLLDSLSGSPMYDLFVFADETQGPLAVFGATVVSHNVGMCADLGLKVDPVNHAKVFWLCGDYPLYCAFSLLPDYDYYLMMEFDVHIVRGNPLFIEGFIHRVLYHENGSLDFVGTKILGADRSRGFGKDGARIFKNVYYSGIFATVMISRRAVKHLQEIRIVEGQDPRAEGVLVHCEVFAISAAMNCPDFRCSELNKVVPGCVSPDNKSYHGGSPTLTPPNFLLGSVLDDNPQIELVHPVLDGPDYLGRLWRHYERVKDVDSFLAHLAEISPDLVDASLRAEFIKKACAFTLPTSDYDELT